MSKLKRMEAKKRKIEAFLELAKLNDLQGRQRKSLAKQAKLDEGENEEEAETDLSNAAKANDDLSGDALQELRNRLRERKKKLKSIPKLDLKAKGHDATFDIPENMRTPLFMRDLQQFLLHALMGNQAPVDWYKRWFKIEQWNKLTKINVLAIDGLGSEDFSDASLDISSVKSIFPFQLEFISPISYNSNLAEELSILPLTNSKREKLVKHYGNMRSALHQGQAFNVLSSMFKMAEKKQGATEIEEDSAKSTKLKLLLSLAEMVEENYPLPMEGPMKQKFASYVFSQDEYQEVSKDSPLFSVDCEMCMTTQGQLELTKVCVVDCDLNVVYHSFVKPDNPITNYLTRYSGITAEMLQDVTTKLADVQAELKRLLPPNAIWVGQSLNSDLRALQMMHPYVIDTSVIFNISGTRGRKTKLKVLSEMFLGEKIQCHGSKGHDPKEDAIAAMKLVLLKLEKGYSYGDSTLEEVAINPSKGPTPSYSTSWFNEMTEKDKKVSIVAPQPILETYSHFASKDTENSPTQLLVASNSKEAVKTSCTIASDQDMTVCHVMLDSLKVEKNMAKLKKWTSKMWSCTAINGLFVTVWTGSPTQRAFVGIALNKAELD